MKVKKKGGKKKKGLTKTETKAVKTVVNRVLNKNAELKRHVVDYTDEFTQIPFIGATGPFAIAVNLTNVPTEQFLGLTGPTPFTREGNKIMPKRLLLRILMQRSAGVLAGITTCRVVVFRYKQFPDDADWAGGSSSNVSSAPFTDLADPFDQDAKPTNGMQQVLLKNDDVDYAKAFVKLYDKTHRINDYEEFDYTGCQSAFSKIITIDVKGKKMKQIPVQFTDNGGGTSSLGINQYYVMFMSETNNAVSYKLGSTLWYTDF